MSQGQVTLGGLQKGHNKSTKDNPPLRGIGGFDSTGLMLEVPKQTSILYVR